jgi:hypothetical protein
MHESDNVLETCDRPVNSWHISIIHALPKCISMLLGIIGNCIPLFITRAHMTVYQSYQQRCPSNGSLRGFKGRVANTKWCQSLSVSTQAQPFRRGEVQKRFRLCQGSALQSLSYFVYYTRIGGPDETGGTSANRSFGEELCLHKRKGAGCAKPGLGK